MTYKSQNIPWEQCDERRKAALVRRWVRGDLTYKLHPSQREVYDLIHASFAKEVVSPRRYFILDIGRQWGKDFLQISMAIEMALKHPGTRIPYGCMTEKSLKEIMVPTFQTIISDCPPELQPKILATGHFRFPNGAEIRMVGVNQDPDGLRGPSTKFAFLTECGFMRRLDYVQKSVILPMLQTHPDGFHIYASTPSETPQHYWSAHLVPRGMEEGKCVTKTIDDNPMLSPEMREAIIDEMGGRTSVTVRRELYCEHIADDRIQLIPEWSEELVKEVEKPPYRHCYIACDIGYTDQTAVLFAYFDFEKGLIVVEDELFFEQTASGEIARDVDAKERELWEDDPGATLVHRVVDAQDITIADLQASVDEWSPSQRYQAWMKAEKDDAIGAHNLLREWVRRKKIAIHPRCRTLIQHMRHGIWKKDAEGMPTKHYARSDNYGHFDGVAAMKYLVRHVHPHLNPFPEDYGVLRGDNVMRSGQISEQARQTERTLLSLVEGDFESW